MVQSKGRCKFYLSRLLADCGPTRTKCTALDALDALGAVVVAVAVAVVAVVVVVVVVVADQGTRIGRVQHPKLRHHATTTAL